MQDYRAKINSDGRTIMNFWLLLAGFLTAVAALTHMAVIIGGPDWYRFFGAGEQMAQMAEQGSLYPATITAGIAMVLGVWSLYAFSGAGFILRLPLLKAALILIAAVFLLRGLLAIPAAYFLQSDPHLQELAARPVFLWVSSAICVGLGLCYAVGAWQVWVSFQNKGRPDSRIH